MLKFTMEYDPEFSRFFVPTRLNPNLDVIIHIGWPLSFLHHAPYRREIHPKKTCQRLTGVFRNQGIICVFASRRTHDSQRSSTPLRLEPFHAFGNPIILHRHHPSTFRAAGQRVERMNPAGRRFAAAAGEYPRCDRRSIHHWG